jgi:release factor glutamine methyltransferase
MIAPPSTIVDRLRKAGCVFAEDEAAILEASAASPERLDAMVAQRVSGLPLEQVVGWAEFWGLRIEVDPGVFVPRRRSELLVEVAIGLALPAAPVIVDLCCGTGALGLATVTGLSRAGLDTQLHAAELDPVAVACARRNVEPAGGQVYEGDLFAPLPGSLRGRVSILICNAPYVPTAEIAFMPPEAREHEARMALDGGGDGLAILRRVAAQALGWLAPAPAPAALGPLAPGGTLLVETSERQAGLMADVMTSAGLSPRVHTDEEMGATVVTGTRR